MIINGSEGSISFYFKGLLISSFPMTKKKTKEYYFSQGNTLIIDGMRNKYNVKKLIQIFTLYCNSIYIRKRDKKPIYASDHKLFMESITALMKLKIVENDSQNGYLIMPKKKLSIHNV